MSISRIGARSGRAKLNYTSYNIFLYAIRNTGQNYIQDKHIPATVTNRPMPSEVFAKRPD